MRIQSLAVGFVISCGIASAAAAQATDRPGVAFGLLGGSTMSSGSMTRSIYTSGFIAGALAEFPTPVDWLGVRLDGRYQQLGTPSFVIVDQRGAQIGTSDAVLGMFSGAASVVLRIPNLHSVIQPYAIAGEGEFLLRVHVKTSDGRSGTSTNSTRGSDAGLGLEARLGHFAVFTEGRYQRIGELRMIPVSLGLRTR